MLFPQSQGSKLRKSVSRANCRPSCLITYLAQPFCPVSCYISLAQPSNEDSFTSLLTPLVFTLLPSSLRQVHLDQHCKAEETTRRHVVCGFPRSMRSISISDARKFVAWEECGIHHHSGMEGIYYYEAVYGGYGTVFSFLSHLTWCFSTMIKPTCIRSSL